MFAAEIRYLGYPACTPRKDRLSGVMPLSESSAGRLQLLFVPRIFFSFAMSPRHPPPQPDHDELSHSNRMVNRITATNVDDWMLTCISIVLRVESGASSVSYEVHMLLCRRFTKIQATKHNQNAYAAGRPSELVSRAAEFDSFTALLQKGRNA